MNRYLLFIPALFITSLCMTSCEDSSNSNSAFENLAPSGITGVNTKNEEEFCCWQAGSQINFTAANNYYESWNITIVEASGSMQSISTDHLHWRGKIQYQDKDKNCKEMIYIDSLIFDIATTEARWSEGTFRIGTMHYEKGTNPGPFSMTTFYINPEAGNMNTLNVSDQNHIFIFKFKTRTADDINSWKIEQIPQGWMNSNGKFSMLMIPILYSMFQ
jgi:hypothetical protein